MGILDEIIKDAIESMRPLSDLLRKCKVLASRLQNFDFLNWVNSELEGYPNVESLPEYRKFQVGSYGNFYGPFGRSLKNVAIPSIAIPDEYREKYKTANLIQSVSALEDLSRSNESGQYQIPWPPDFTAIYGNKILENMVCLSAWQQISRSELVTILDVVRNRILNFALELERINPDIGSLENETTKVTTNQLSHIFNTVILGNIGQYSSMNQSLNFQIEVKAGNLQSLKDFLLSNKVSEDDLRELINILEEMKKLEKFDWTKSLNNWFGTMMSKAATGVWNIGMSVAATVLTTAISRYLGLK